MAPKDTFFRSSDMSLTQLYIANEIGREVVSALGELGQVQFRDVSLSGCHFTALCISSIRPETIVVWLIDMVMTDTYFYIE